MPKLKADTQIARRERILDAAEICFARSGFHRCTMQEICREAGISPGALYVYFSSKEQLIAGLAERDRSEFQSRFDALADAQDFLAALKTIGDQYFVDEPAHKRLMCVEVGIESTRNETVGEIFRSVDRHVSESFEQFFERLAHQGRIAPELDIPTLAQLFAVIGDGMMWRRAVDPTFKPDELMPAVVKLVSMLVNPTAANATTSSPPAEGKTAEDDTPSTMQKAKP